MATHMSTHMSIHMYVDMPVTHKSLSGYFSACMDMPRTIMQTRMADLCVLSVLMSAHTFKHMEAPVAWLLPCTHVCAHVYTHAYTHAYAHAYTHVYTHVET